LNSGSKSIRENRLLLANRLKISQALGEKDQVIYYSSWYYAAIHALASIPGFKSSSEISKYLQLDLKKVQEAIEFLILLSFQFQWKMPIKFEKCWFRQLKILIL
jgi:hypothetical protein